MQNCLQKLPFYVCFWKISTCLLFLIISINISVISVLYHTININIILIESHMILQWNLNDMKTYECMYLSMNNDLLIKNKEGFG